MIKKSVKFICDCCGKVHTSNYLKSISSDEVTTDINTTVNFLIIATAMNNDPKYMQLPNNGGRAEICDKCYKEYTQQIEDVWTNFEKRITARYNMTRL